MGHLMRLELTLVRSVNVFPFSCGFHIEFILSFSLSLFTFVCFTSL